MALAEQLALVGFEEEDFPAKAPGALCGTCPYKNQPFVPTDSPQLAERAIVGIAPHTNEVRQGVPFIGPSGKLLNVALQQAGIPRDEVMITNAVLCKPTRGTEPTPEALASCFPRLQREIREAGVTKIMPMGKIPLDAIAPLVAQGGIVKARGAWIQCEEFPDVDILPTYHPAYALRGSPTSFKDIVDDVTKFGRKREYFPDPTYDIIETHEQLQTYVDHLLKFKFPIVADLETSNINLQDSTPNEWWNGYILCLALCWRPGEVVIVPERLFNSRTTLKILKPLLERKEGLVGHNLKFDVLYLKHYYHGDIEIHIAQDTLLMHYVLDERKGTHALTSKLTGYYFDDADYDDAMKKYLKRPKLDSYSLIPREMLYRYGGKDVDYTYRLMEIFTKRLKDLDLYEYPYRKVLMLAVQALVDTERTGMYIYPDSLRHAKDVLGTAVEDGKWDIRDLAKNGNLNPNSPQQMSYVLYQQLGLKCPKGRKIKPGSTNKEALTKLKGKHPIIEVIMKYRRMAKLHSTYAKKIENFVDHEGHIHFSFNLAGAVTGRLEAGLLLTIPRAYTPEGKLIRNCFGARPGYILVGADFSQAELRWLGWFAQEMFLYGVYANDRDLHTEVAIAMYGEEFTKEDRMKTKMFNFSWAYGGNEFSFAEDAGLPIEIARQWVAKYNRNMPDATKWKKRIINQAKTTGVLRTPMGRLRRFPLITQQNVHEIKNQATNFLPSSISSDVTITAFSRLNTQFKREKLDVKPVLFLHDGIYFQVPDEPNIIEHVGKAQRQTMLDVAYQVQDEAGGRYPEFANLKTMPFKVDISTGERWGAMDDLEL